MPHIDLNRLVDALEPGLRVALEDGASIAARQRHQAVDLTHWLRGIVAVDGYATLLASLSVPVARLTEEIDRALDDVPVGDTSGLALSQTILTLGREAFLLATLQSGRRKISLIDVLQALDEDPELRSIVRGVVPSLRGMDRAALDALQRSAAQAEVAGSASSGAQGLDALSGAQNAGRADEKSGENEFLRLYTHDMTEDARKGRIDPVIGRGDELHQVIDILTRRRQNNPILVGEAGVGKTAVAEALAIAIAQGDVPEKLKTVRLLMLDLSLLQAGAGVKGEFERRLHGVIDAVKRSAAPIILFIDEAHGLVGAGGAGAGDAANILKPALARGEVRTLAATTWSEYKRYFEKDAALTRRFQAVQVREPDEQTAIRMLRGIAQTFVDHHGVTIRDEAIVAAVQLSARYLPARQLPDKAVSLLDTASAAVALARQTVPETLRRLETERDLLCQEADWLKREPEDADIAARSSAIATETSRLAGEIAEMKAQYEAELACLDLAESRDRKSNVSPLRPTDPIGAGESRLVPLAVDREVVAAVVARWTGIPLGKVLTDRIESLRTLDERMRQRIIGQDAAIGRIADTMRSAGAGLADPRRPPAVFLFVGMSGTGKTETALALADLLYGGAGHLTTINMSEFKEEHKVSLLLGSPPGYVGYGEGGILTEAVRRRPYGVLLLDEMDKAHPGVQDMFYQVFDKGLLRDSEGRDVDFKNTTICMTANTGSDLLASLAADPDTMPEGEALTELLLPELKKHFKPAFLGRAIVLPFLPLGETQLSRIVDIQIGRIRDRVAASYGTDLALSDRARETLVAGASASDFGARAIEVMIGRDLLPPLSRFFLERLAAGRRGGMAVVDWTDEGFRIVADAAQDTHEFAAVEPAGVDKAAGLKGVPELAAR